MDGDRINRHLAELSAFGKNDYGGVSRVAYSEFDKQGRAWAMGVMREAGLTVSIDAAGNIFGRRAGPQPVAQADRLRIAHRLGARSAATTTATSASLSAIEVARTLGREQARHEAPAGSGDLPERGRRHGGQPRAARRADRRGPGPQDAQRQDLGDGITFIGGDLAKLATVKRAPGDVAAYVELHIEQGGNLDREKLDIGVVEGIVGIGQWEVTAEGIANHAGTTAMSDRRDSLLATGRYIDMVNRVITGTPGRQVGTVGRVQAFPGAPNVIPGKVVFTLEIRDLDQAKVDALSREGACRGRGHRQGDRHDVHLQRHCTTAVRRSATSV